MDHRVSKDMISSGMTPSGEKTQADLGKTQYGSAPSPNRLMDAYHSMYQNQKEETVDEGMVGDAIKKVKFQVSNVTDKAAKDQRRAIVRKRLEDVNTKNVNDSVDLLSAYQSIYADTFEEGKIPAGLQAYLDKKKGKKKDDDDNGDDEKESKKKAKKDVKEGAGLYANIHAKRKRGGKMRKKGAKGAPSAKDFANAARTAKEDFDKYDLVYNHFIEEGFSEEETYERMSNLTEEQIDEFIGLALGAGKMLLGKIGATAAAGKVAAGAATKGALAAKSAKIASAAGTAGKTAATTTQAAKPLTGIAKQSFTAPSVTPPKPMVNAPTQSKVTTSGGKTAPGTDLRNLKDKNKNLLTKAKDSFNNMSTLEKVYTAQGVSSLVPSGGSSQGTNKISKTRQISADPNKKPIAASADLFDIVKGQLLDEGCTEEEIKEIMTTLTPEEIMNEMAVNPKIVAMDAKNKADMIKRAKAKEIPQDVRDAAKRQYKAGTPREDPKNPYTTDDKKKIINQYKDN